MYTPANAPAWDVFNLSGLVAVITGGGSGMITSPYADLVFLLVLTHILGLGLMFAKALEANGAAKVYIIGRNWQKLEAAAAQSVIQYRVLSSRASFIDDWSRNTGESCPYPVM